MKFLQVSATLLLVFSTAFTASADDPAAAHKSLMLGPRNYLHTAKTLYNLNDRFGAAAELGKAGSMLDVVADFDKDDSPEQKQLRAAAVELRRLSAEVKDGKAVPTLSMLETIIAKANVAMAFHHFNKAGTAIDDAEGREAHLAGHHLLAAAQYMEAAGQTATAPLTAASQTLHRKVDKYATKLIINQKTASGSGDQLKEDFIAHLKKLGQDIENRTASDPSNN